MTDYKPFFLILILVTWFLLSQLFVYPNYHAAPIDFSALFQRHKPLTEIVNNADGIKVICQPECWFIVGDDRIPARLGYDASGQLHQLNLHFVDEKRGLIGYDNASKENPEFYVLSYERELVQIIQLDLNHQRQMQFAGYYPDSRQILFNSTDGTRWLYSAISPNLRKI